MDRRRAITRILFFGGAGIAGYTGLRAYKLFRSPDLDSLNARQSVLDELAETIIPKTDTPGAKEAEVGAFIVKMVRDCTDIKSQNQFVKGLNDLVSFASTHYGKPFIKCSVDEKNKIVHHFQKKRQPFPGFLGKVERKLIGDSFFTTLKKYTVLGYCTSRLGATEGLAYDYIPGKYVVAPLKQGQKAWATQ